MHVPGHAPKRGGRRRGLGRHAWRNSSRRRRRRHPRLRSRGARPRREGSVGAEKKEEKEPACKRRRTVPSPACPATPPSRARSVLDASLRPQRHAASGPRGTAQAAKRDESETLRVDRLVVLGRSRCRGVARVLAGRGRARRGAFLRGLALRRPPRGAGGAGARRWPGMIVARARAEFCAAASSDLGMRNIVSQRGKRDLGRARS